ncbi:MAG: DUF547 domain-containing protein, partial [Bacteroidota bacterium]
LDESPSNAELINLYNLFALQLVLDHYPTPSVKEIPGFFDKQSIRFNNRDYTLDKIESLIKKQSTDGRYHFALICAAQSCPPFPIHSFQDEILEAQLNAQVEKTINKDGFVRVNGELVYLSSIFNWYKKEFKNKNYSIERLLTEYLEEELPNNPQYKYYPYDWALNDVKEIIYNPSILSKSLQSYTPSKLIQKGSFELKLFNNLYTQTKFFDFSSNILPQERSSFYTGIVDFLYGAKPNLNIGFNLFLRASRFDSPSSSFADILKFENNGQARFAVSHIGPSIKIAPFRNKKYSIKSILLIPIESDLDGSKNDIPFLDQNAYQWWNQLFYDTELSAKWRLFAEITTILKLDKDFDFNKSSALIP